MITTIADGHKIDLNILTPDLPVLDLGCRNMLFSNHMKGLGFRVFSVDVDDLPGENYFHCGIGGYDGRCGVVRFKDPNATQMTGGDSVDCFTLASFSKMVGVKFWSLVKMDIEMAEKDVIMSLVKAPALQISCEYHMQCGQMESEIEMTVQHLEKLGYYRADHQITSQYGAGPNYWSSLFILIK